MRFDHQGHPQAQDGNSYLWQPGAKEAEPDRLLGYRLVTSTHMPAIAASADRFTFRRPVQLLDRRPARSRSMQRLSELYAATGQVGFA